MNRIAMVIGSWGSYNECNDRALGSEWLDFDDYNACNKRALGSTWLDLSKYTEWEQIEEELKNEGFELNGIDEGLFVQDIEGMPTNSMNWDYVHPKEIFELIKKSGVLDNEYKYELMEAYCEVKSFDEWSNLVNDYEDDWDRDIIFYRGQDMHDVAYNIVNEFYDLDEMLGSLSPYFDYDAFARDLSYEGYTETSNGVIEIR